MKIGYLITRMDELGGAQVHVRDLALWMHAKGHEVVVLSGAAGMVSEGLQAQGIPYIEIPSLQRSIHPVRDIRAVLELRRALKDLNLDILTCHSSKAGLVGRIAAWTVGLPVVFTAHNWTFGKGVSPVIRPIYWFLEWLGGKLGNHIITVSEHGRRQALQACIAPAHKITTVHNGMPDRPAKPHTAQTPTRLIMVARIGWPKEHAELIRALKTCEDLSWSMDFVGGGDDTALKSLAADLGLSSRIRFLGERKDVADLLENHADIFILTSAWEGFPLSILEAMRSGLPVIASDAGGSRESVEHGVTGFIAPSGENKDLPQALRKLISNTVLQEQMGQAGRKSFENSFTFDTMAAKTLAIYSHVLE